MGPREGCFGRRKKKKLKIGFPQSWSGFLNKILKRRRLHRRKFHYGCFIKKAGKGKYFLVSGGNSGLASNDVVHFEMRIFIPEIRFFPFGGLVLFVFVKKKKKKEMTEGRIRDEKC